MSDHQRITIFLAVLRRFLSEAGSQAWSSIVAELGAKETIALTDGLYFRIGRSGFTLVSARPGDSQSMKVSLDEAKMIFKSIESAIISHGFEKTRVGELSWTTDARPKSDAESMVIKFIGSLGSTREIARRREVAAAIAKFANRFGG